LPASSRALRRFLCSFRRLAALRRRHDLAVAFAAYEARNTAGVEPADKDPATYVGQAEAGMAQRADGSLGIGALKRG
jgi:hypothetical protein